MDSVISPTSRPRPVDWIFRVLGFLLLAVMAFSLPEYADATLDSSWRMAIGRFFVEGRQFGTEAVFTYGPLGFIMGKTYWGGQWGLLVGCHVVQAVVFAGFIYWNAFRLTGYPRVFFLSFFLIFGLTYEDAANMTIIALGGAELIRRCHQRWHWSSALLVALLAVISLVKFTNLVLAAFLILLAAGLELWNRRWLAALRLPGLFVGLYVLGWLLCRQNPLHLPAYLHSSWQISEGYQDVMGLSCPTAQLERGLIELVLVLSYLALNWFTHPDRKRVSFLTVAALAYLYLNWKHGFIRADGHQIGFYYAAMTVIVSAPLMLEESARWRVAKQTILVFAGLLFVVSIDLVLPGLSRGCLGIAQQHANRIVSAVFEPAKTRSQYDDRFQQTADLVNLAKTRKIAGHSPVDVLGYEQAAAIINGLNYQPRPVFQSYSAYTPYLAHLNYDYYASDRAPDFVLLKVQSIDDRLPMMDDADVLRLLVQRYTYQFSDVGFSVWKKNPGAFDPADYAPRAVRSATVGVGEPVDVSDLNKDNLWVQVDFHYTLLGKLRRFFFKPPLVQLAITDEKGAESRYRLSQPIGQNGFIVNPVINDLVDFMRFTGGKATRLVRSLAVLVAPQDRDCVGDEITVSIFSLPPSTAGNNYFKESARNLFNMFIDVPESYRAVNPPSEALIGKRKVMVMHAPSEMIFEVPAGATELHGAYGFLAGAYTNGGTTTGAEFIIHWSDGVANTPLHDRLLDPLHRPEDRGLQDFSLKLPKGTGRVYLNVDPGPDKNNAFDWTAWTDIEFK